VANPKLIEESIDILVDINNDERELDGMFHPSSASGPCIRRAILEKWKTTPTNVPEKGALRVMQMGTIMHEWVQDAVWRHPEVETFYPEVALEDPNYNLKGAADGLVILKDQSKELLEIKTIKSTAMKYGLPKVEHQMQARLYALMLLQQGGESSNGLLVLPTKVDRIRYIYIGKDNFRLDESIEVLEDRTFIETRRYMTMMNELADKEDVTYLPKLGDSWYTNYCPYKGSGMCCGDFRKD
jgi:hypothetical protein